MLSHMQKTIFRRGVLGAGVFGAMAALAGAAAACTPSYTVKAGDTLFTIAEENLGDMTKWSLIFYGNPSIAGGSVVDLPEGIVLDIPCAPGTVVTAPDPTPLQQDLDAELKLLTGSNYAPFSDRNWPGQGMATELVNAALELMPDPVTYSVFWADDWSEKMDALMVEREADMAFPWYRPDCTVTPDDAHCTGFHYSDPLFDLVFLLFVRADSGIRFDTDRDIHGTTICRPEGTFTHDLDRADRQWLSNGLVTLVTAPSVEACFERLDAGQVDAVSVNEFQGVKSMFDLALTERVVPLPRPVSVQGLHVVISKTHWRGTTHLFRFNAGLAALKQTEKYNEIVQRHLALFWEQIRS